MSEVQRMDALARAGGRKSDGGRQFIWMVMSAATTSTASSALESSAAPSFYHHVQKPMVPDATRNCAT